MKPEETKFQQQMQRVETLVEEIESTADPAVRAKTLELIQTLMDFHGAGIGRMMDITANTGAAGYAIFDDFAGDELVASLLLLYDLHPRGIEERIEQAIEKVRPSLNLHEGGVELLGVSNGVVKLRLQGSCDGCPSSAATLKHTIEEAIYAAAPDVTAIEVEGAVIAGITGTAGTNAANAPANGFVQIGKTNGKVYADCEFTAA
jgi:Fe-S cluster biogenesis protein NfuA